MRMMGTVLQIVDMEVTRLATTEVVVKVDVDVLVEVTDQDM